MTFKQVLHFSQTLPVIWVGVTAGMHLFNPTESVALRVFYGLLFVLMDVFLTYLFTITRDD